MATTHHFLLGAVVLATIALRSVWSHECDCSQNNKGTAGCDQYTAAIQECIEPVKVLPQDVDVPTMCSMYNATVTCMETTLPACDNPPADSVRWTELWGQIQLTGESICTYSPDDTSCENFEAQALTCVMPLMKAVDSGTDISELCGPYEDTKDCIVPLMSRCPDQMVNSSLGNLKASWDMMTQQMEGNC